MTAYPVEFEVDVVLRDGSTVYVRPIRPTDQDALSAFFERTGPESRYYRFFRSKTKLTAKELEYYTTVDYERRMAFVAFDERDLIGVARYDESKDHAGVAEVAFMVEDAQQGRGIGTQLLQLLTVYARSQGIHEFEAFVLPENAQMMRLFRNSGYRLTRSLDDGIYTVAFPTAESEDSAAAEARRERRAVAASILPLFYPRSIAVVGASREEKSIGATLFRNLLTSNYTGALYPVHPTAGVVNSVRAYPSVLDIPDPVDLAFIVVPAAVVLDVVRDCAEKEVRGIVVISAGFSETGEEGYLLEEELLSIVRAAGMRMVGPNCMGLINTDSAVQLNGTFAPVHPPRGNVAILSQSGALGIAILDHARRHSIGISSFVSVGNKADLSGNDLILYWEGDPGTDVIVLYLESFGNPRRFARIARRVARTKPIIAVKSGRTRPSADEATSHARALAGSDRAVEALFRQAGVIRTDTLEGLFGVASLLAHQPVPAGRRVGIVTNAGGPALLATDSLEANGMVLPEFSPALQSRLAEALPPSAGMGNPVALATGAGPDEYEHAIGAIMSAGEVDAIMAIYVPTTQDGATEVATAIRDMGAVSGDTTLLSVLMSEGGSAEPLQDERVSVPSFEFPEAAAKALAEAATYGEWLRRPTGGMAAFDDVDLAKARSIVDSVLDRLDGPGWLDPGEVRELLGAFGITVPRSTEVQAAGDAVLAATEMNGPVALKLVSPSVAAGTDAGGIALDIQGDAAVAAAFERLTSGAADASRVVVQEMVSEGHEVLIGMTEDPSFGPIIVFGLGGVYVDLLADVSFRINPLTDLDAVEMIREIRAAPLLTGYRGGSSGDLEALTEVLLRVSAMVQVVPEMAELDLNPVKVLQPGDGIRVLDGRIRLHPLPDHWAPELVDIPSVIADRPHLKPSS